MVLLKNYTQLPNEVFQNADLSLKAIGLYAYLKYRSFGGNAYKACFPSQKTMMKDLGIGSQSTLKKVIDELIVNDCLDFKRGSIFTGNSNYFLKIPKKSLDDTS